MNTTKLILRKQIKNLNRFIFLFFAFCITFSCDRRGEMSYLLTNSDYKYWYYNSDSRGLFDDTPSTFFYLNANGEYRAGNREENVFKVFDNGSWELRDSLIKFSVPYNFHDTMVHKFKIIMLSKDSLLLEQTENKVQVLYLTILEGHNDSL